MAEYVKNLKKCRVMIRDITTGELLADTEIVTHDVRRNILTIGTDHLSRKGKSKVTVVVFAPKCLYEYSGTVRRELPGSDMEIAVYGEKQKDERGYQRYDMQTGGRVEGLFIQRRKVELRRPIPVNVKNISANGILFQAGVHDFSVGDQITLRIEFRESKFSSDYEIVRTQNRYDGYQEYGCRSLSETEQNAVPQAPASAKERIDSEKADAVAGEFIRRQRELEDKLGYRELLENVQRFVPLLQLPEILEHPMVFDDPHSQAGAALEKLAEDIGRSAPVMNRELLFNAGYFKCGMEEAKARHILNTALLSALAGAWQAMEPDRLLNLVKAALLVGVPLARQFFGDGSMANIVTAADIYDMRASHPSGVKAAVPFAALEQFYLQGQNESADSVRGVGKLLAEKVLHSLNEAGVVLADRNEAEIVYIPPNDITHPVLRCGDSIWQENDSWEILGFAVDEAKLREPKEASADKTQEERGTETQEDKAVSEAAAAMDEKAPE